MSTSYPGPSGMQPYQDLTAGFTPFPSPQPGPCTVSYQGGCLPPTCTQSVYGACTVVACPQALAANPPGTVSAGIVTVTGTAETLAAALDGGTYQEEGAEQKPIWTGGETITASAPGGVVPPFTLSGIAPADLNLQSPALPFSSPMSLNRFTGLPFAWASNGGGNVLITLSVNTAQQSVLIFCDMPQGPGGGVVPTGALQQLPLNQQGIFTVTATEYFTKNVGGWILTLQLLGRVTAGGAPEPLQSGAFMVVN